MVISLLKKNTHGNIFSDTVAVHEFCRATFVTWSVWIQYKRVCIMRCEVRESTAKGNNMCVHALKAQRFLKGRTLWEAGGDRRQRNILPGSQGNLVCSPKNIHTNRKGTVLHWKLILGTSLVIQRLQILRTSLVIQWLWLPSSQSHRFNP